MVCSIEPANFIWVMSQDFDNWGVEPLRMMAAEPFVGRSMFTTDGAFWQHTRSQLKPVLGQAQFSDFQKIELHLQRFFDLIPEDGKVFDALPLLDRLMTDIGTEFLFGHSVNSLTSDCTIDSKNFIQALEVAMTEVHRRHLQGWLVSILPQNKKFLQACTLIHEVVNQQISETFDFLARSKIDNVEDNSPQQKLILVRELAKQTKDRDLIRGNVLTTYAAGTESQAVVVNNILFLLSRRPDVVQKLRHEITSIGRGNPTLDVLKKMHYLKAVINETLRLYPLAPFIWRTALTDTILPVGGGCDGLSPIFIRKDTIYSVNLFALHRDVVFWGQDAEEFNPDRWNSPPTNLSGRYQPFGGGKRTCPGQALAIAEISYTIVRILQEFTDIKSGDARPWLENLKMTFSNRNGVLISLKHS